MLGHRLRSIVNGNAPVEVPDLRDPAQRDLWRNDDRAPFPTAAHPEPAEPPCSSPVEDVDPQIYVRQQESLKGAGYPPVERM